MSKKKYYIKHVDSSGFASYRRLSVHGVIGFVMNLARGESLYVIKDTPGLERRLNNTPNIFEDQPDE